MSSRSALLLSIITEYGIPWAVNRSLYNCKLKLLNTLPQTERWFEPKNASVQRLNLFKPNIKAIIDFLGNLPAEKKYDLLRAADDVCDGKILGFSSILLDYGTPINWQLNPLTGIACSNQIKWFRIPDFDTERGDIKAIWEASRFTHFYTLARAYLLSRDAKYYVAFSCQLDEWLRKNPYSFGANYKCGQECALRMINGLMAYAVFSSAGIAMDRDKKNTAELVSRCYRKILSNFFYAYRCIKNNHTISELMGMIAGAWCCGDEPRIEKAYRLLNKVILQQFTEDGGYTQFSFNYQRMALQDIECVLSIVGKTGGQLSDEAVQRVLNSCQLLYQCQSDNGDVPNYGSNDGALIFPVTCCGYRDFRPTINGIHALLQGTRLYEPGLYDEELLWFSGGIEKYRVARAPRKSCSFTQAGLFTIRTQNRYMMIVLNNYQSRPAHMDQQHVDLWIDGVNAFCDSGTYSYSNTEGTLFASTSGHNTVKIFSLEQMNKHGAFLLYNWTKRKSAEWVDGQFVGEMVSANGYAHKRTVKVLDNGYQIIDEITTSKGTAFEILFHTPCHAMQKEDGIQLSQDGRIVCSLSSDADELAIEESERSLFYLSKEGINCIHILGKTKDGYARITTSIAIQGGNI